MGLIASASAPVRVGAVELVPIYNLTLLGGQYFFSGSRSNLNGNAVGNVAPVLRFSDRWSLLPVYNVAYQGTKQVTDPVGSSSLFQQLMDHRLSFTGIHTPADSPWRFKPNASYKVEFMKETRDEAWGKGLFDYHKAGVGLEAENVYKDPFSYRMAYDFYYVRFPNYESLESKSGVDPNGNPLGRETAGVKVLDTLNYQLSFILTRPIPFNEPVVSLQAGYNVVFQHFPDQPVIDGKGQPSTSNRRDFIQSLSASVAHPRALLDGEYRLVSRFGASFAYDDSNQSSFDASRAVYIPDAYTYYSWSVGPSATLSWGEERQPTWTSVGLSYSSQRYSGRLAQNADGLYLGEKQHQDRVLLSLGYNYPIAPNFSLKAQTNFLWAASNMAYERTYRYTYRTANYLFGFGYDY